MSLFTARDSRPIHFVGIGGAGMSALALVARRRGVGVTGCDINRGGAGDVERAGVVVFDGHDPSHVIDAGAVVYTSAVGADHPEVVAARTAGIPVFRRAEALQATIEGGTVVAVAGTHGKTTTTVMVAEMLAAAGRDPTGIAGGRVANWEGNARLGESTTYVVEADEYDRSFLALNPTVAVVGNVEADHLECYGSVAELEDAFSEFLSRAERGVIGVDDAGAARVALRADIPTWTVGLNPTADVVISDIEQSSSATTARLTLPGDRTLDFRVPVPGLHNVRNATNAFAAVAAVDADLGAAAEALAEFHGVGRRFEVLGKTNGRTVVDDYAHHPTEIAVTIGAARQRFPGSRIVAVFQPHLYSRTQQHAAAMGITLSAADVVVVTEIYPAREDPIEGVTSELVVASAKAAGIETHFCPALDQLAVELKSLTRKGDVIVMMGAGDITEVAHEMVHGQDR